LIISFGVEAAKENDGLENVSLIELHNLRVATFSLSWLDCNQAFLA
jgi:hypothetical protein